MNLPPPDATTAAAMQALLALAMAWVLCLLGRGAQRGAGRWVLGAGLLYSLSALASAAAHAHPPAPAATWGATLALHLALACLVQGLQGLHPTPWPRWVRCSHLAWPCLASSLLALLWLVPAPARFGSATAAVVGVQLAALCHALLRLRLHHGRASAGAGWLLASALTLASVAVGWQYTPHSAPLAWGLWLLQAAHVVWAITGWMRLQQAQQAASAQHSAMLDTLTQLPNRAALVPHLQAAIQHAAEQQQPLAVLVLDIDHFKSVNDSYGHLVGDQVIQHLARVLQRHGRSDDFAARYGGEEFVMVLPALSVRSALHYAESLCQAMRQAPVRLPSGQVLHITISVGVYAGIPSHGSGWQRLVELADAAMYVAKRNGRDRVALSAALQSMAAPEIPVWDTP